MNIAVLAGHSMIRVAAMNGPDEPADISMMKAALAEAVEAGVVGLSTGLIYDPGSQATTDELIELASVQTGTGCLYATHLRDEETGLLDAVAVAEALRIGQAADIAVQISHHKASGRAAWGLVAESLAMIDQARERGSSGIRGPVPL